MGSFQTCEKVCYMDEWENWESICIVFWAKQSHTVHRTRQGLQHKEQHIVMLLSRSLQLPMSTHIYDIGLLSSTTPR